MIKCEYVTERGYYNLTKEGEEFFIKKAIKKHGIGFWKNKKNSGKIYGDTVYFETAHTHYPVRVSAIEVFHCESRDGQIVDVKLFRKKKYTYIAETVPFVGY